MKMVLFSRYLSRIAGWSVRLGGVLCCALLLWGLECGRAHAEDTLTRISRALTFDSLASSDKSPEWLFSEEGIPAWRMLEKGLELGLFPAQFGDSKFEVVVLRIDPAEFVFSVYTVSQNGRALSLGEWARQHGLVAAINASMYLPDGVTSTGYLRVGETINNGRIVSKFGAFFVADPIRPGGSEGILEPVGNVISETAAAPELPAAELDSPEPSSGTSENKANSVDSSPEEAVSPVSVNSSRENISALPEADILDRSADNWEPLLPRYRMVVQNYRLISSDRRLLWTPGGPRHSIAAVGKDGAGRILFFLCREPLTGVEFGTLLLALPIDVHVVMYTEGGSQAGLLLDSATYKQIWMGRYLADIWTSGNLSAPLPNVIGIRRRY